MHPEIGCIKKINIKINKTKNDRINIYYSAFFNSPLPVNVQLNVAVSPLVAVADRLVTNALPV